MKLFRAFAVFSISTVLMTLSYDANALIVSGSYSGIVTNTFVTGNSFMSIVAGTPVDGDFSFNASLIPGTGGSYIGLTYPSPVSGPVFAFSDNGNSYPTGFLFGVNFTVSNNNISFINADSTLNLNFAVPLALLTNPGSFSLAGINIGDGLSSSLIAPTFFNINSIALTSSDVSAVPLPASLPLFGGAFVVLGIFFQRRSIRIT